MDTGFDPVGWWEGLDRPLRRASRPLAIFLIALIAALLAYSVVSALPGKAPPIAAADADTQLADDDGDLALYRRIADRVIAGEDYYAAALDEQRSSNYPTRPFVTVRLPTLAMANAALGEATLRIILFVALPLSIMALMARVEGMVRPPERVGAGIAMLLGGAGLIIPDAPLIHEVVAGVFLSLAFALHRPGCWWPALLFAAFALSVRELAAPFVMLWLCLALAGRRWREASAVAALLCTFALALYLHYLGVEAQRLPGDAASQGWDALAGIGLPLAAMSSLTALLYLPPWLAAPLAVLPLVGWAGLGGRPGLFGALWFAGYFAMMALFARPENFYWVQMVLPVYLAGFAFAPRAMADLVHAAAGKSAARN